jgi:hypothetical protein
VTAVNAAKFDLPPSLIEPRRHSQQRHRHDGSYHCEDCTHPDGDDDSLGESLASGVQQRCPGLRGQLSCDCHCASERVASDLRNRMWHTPWQQRCQVSTTGLHARTFCNVFASIEASARALLTTVPERSPAKAGQVDGCALMRKMALLGRSIHVRGKGCAHDTTTSSRRSVFPLSA